jgi:hypothetical protein
MFLLFLSFINIKFNIFWIVAVVLFVYLLQRSLSGRSALKQSGSKSFLMPVVQVNILNTFLFIFLFFNIVIVFMKTMMIETDMWDSWAFWAFKAKLFYFDQCIPFVNLDILKLTVGNWDYPLHLPLLETTAALWIGKWDETLYRIIFPVYFSGICVMVFFYIYREKGYYPALIATCLMASLHSLQFWTTATIGESVMIFYWLTSFLILLRWKKEFQQDQAYAGLLRLSAIFMGLSIWVKSEAFVLLVCNISVLMFFNQVPVKRRLLLLIGYVGMVVLINLPWHMVRCIFDLSNPLLNAELFNSFSLCKIGSKILNVPNVLGLFIFNLKSWNIVWFSFAITLFYSVIRHLGRGTQDVFRSVVTMIGAYIVGYIFCPWEDNVFVFDTMQRLMLSPALLAILYISLIWGSPVLGQRKKMMS